MKKSQPVIKAAMPKAPKKAKVKKPKAPKAMKALKAPKKKAQAVPSVEQMMNDGKKNMMMF